MAKKLLTVLFAFAVAFSLSTLLLAQDKPAEAKAPAADKAAKEGRWEGIVIRSNKEKSTLTVKSVDKDVERTVVYDSSTQWTSKEHRSKKVNVIDASQVKDDDRVICIGVWEKNGVLRATMISKRLSNQ
jgi:esterase/lipase superfamily enzyme